MPVSLESHPRATSSIVAMVSCSSVVALRVSLGLAVFALVVTLLHALLFLGRAHSIDALLYAQSLEAIASHEMGAEALGRAPLEVHGHLVLYLLAPLTHWLHPTWVLIGAQGIALGTTFGLLANSRRTLLVSPLLLASPLVINPFLFDIRPGLIGVPFFFYALQRTYVQTHSLGGRSLLAYVAAALCREEFALLAALAVWILAPRMPSRRDRIKRLLLACVFALYFVAYYAFTRVGGQHDSLLLHTAASVGFSQLIEYKALLVASWLLSAGGLWLLASKRLVVLCAAGLFPAFVSTWMIDSQVSFHYGMFAIAPVLLATRQALTRLHMWTTWKKLAPLGLCIAGFLIFSALPGGGAFREEHFNLLRAQVSPLKVHKHLAQEPADRPLVVPFEYAAPLADRLTTQSTYAWRKAGAPILSPPQRFVIPARELGTTEPYLAAHGFHVEKMGSGVAFFSRFAQR